MRKTLRYLVPILALPLLIGSASALDADNPFGATAVSELALPAGGSGEVVVNYGILDHNWFLYRDMSSVELATEDSPLKVDSPLVWIAKSMSEVVPPKAAAFVPLSKSSAEVVPPKGMSRWV